MPTAQPAAFCHPPVDFPPLTKQPFPLPTSHFPLRTSHFPFRTSATLFGSFYPDLRLNPAPGQAGFNPHFTCEGVSTSSPKPEAPRPCKKINPRLFSGGMYGVTLSSFRTASFQLLPKYQFSQKCSTKLIVKKLVLPSRLHFYPNLKHTSPALHLLSMMKSSNMPKPPRAIFQPHLHF